jgi:hypothetical protein
MALRVTRLGEFSHNGRNEHCFTLGKFMKITEVNSQKFGATFILSLEYALILTKIGWAATHLFTLVRGQLLNSTYKYL